MGRDKVVIGMDMGGTNLRFGVVDQQGEVRRLVSTALGDDRGVQAVTERIFGGIEELLRWCDGEELLAQGLSLAAPGIISRSDGAIVYSPNLPGWRDVPLKETIAAKFSLPTRLENDANAAAFGEFWKGGGRGARHVIMLTLGTGVGGGIISDGRLIRGSRGMAGELGHITVVVEGGRLCSCGNRGCLEAYSSGTAVVERVREFWTGSGTPPLNARDVYLLAADGHKLCREIFEEAGYYLGVAMADLVNILNPEVIIIGGGVTDAWDLFAAEAEREMRKRAFTHTDLAEKVAVRRAELGNMAGIVGAAGIHWSEGRA